MCQAPEDTAVNKTKAPALMELTFYWGKQTINNTKYNVTRVQYYEKINKKEWRDLGGRPLQGSGIWSEIWSNRVSHANSREKSISGSSSKGPVTTAMISLLVSYLLLNLEVLEGKGYILSIFDSQGPASTVDTMDTYWMSESSWPSMCDCWFLSPCGSITWDLASFASPSSPGLS